MDGEYVTGEAVARPTMGSGEYWVTQEEENLDWEDLCMLAAVFTLGGVHSVRGVYFRSFLMTGADC